MFLFVSFSHQQLLFFFNYSKNWHLSDRKSKVILVALLSEWSRSSDFQFPQGFRERPKSNNYNRNQNNPSVRQLFQLPGKILVFI